MSIVTETELNRLWQMNGRADAYATTSERQLAIKTEVDRIDSLIETLAREMRAGEVASHRDRNGGQEPEQMEMIAIISRTQHEAEKTVLNNEIFEEMAQLDDQEIDPLDEEWNKPLYGHSRRWEDFLYPLPEPSEDIKAAVKELWTHRGGKFMAWGERLLCQRAEDEMEIPESASDPLTAKLEDQIAQAIAAHEERHADRL